MNLIEVKIDKLTEICDIHNVETLHLFGSVLTDHFSVDSDIDILVQFCEMDVLDYYDNYLKFKEQLENLFNRKIDLVENQAIRNPIFRKVVDREKQLVYERKSTQILVWY